MYATLGFLLWVGLVWVLWRLQHKPNIDRDTTNCKRPLTPRNKLDKERL